MGKQYHLAIDIGASSGRHIIGYMEDGKLVLEEIYRFKNGAHFEGNDFVWDVNALFNSIVAGIAECKKIGKIPVSIGIDTWGVDYALLDENDKLIGNVRSYRDSSMEKVMGEVSEIIGDKELYGRTGLNKQSFNTIYQLYCDKKSGKLKNAKTFLMVPDFFHFLLTGVKKNEYTNASTTALLNSKTRDWDYELIDKLGFPRELFKPLCMPGTKVGSLSAEIKAKVGFDSTVYLPATHDTASAVMAVPNPDMPLYISSGTWSLIGVETPTENTSEEARVAKFSNEGGYGKSVRFLKNIMGLWMMQNVRKEFDDKYDFIQLAQLAREARNAGFESFVDVSDMSFFAPASMVEAVRDYCRKTGQRVPETVGEVSICVYASLAKSYRQAVDELEKMTGKKFKEINIVGGGCQNAMLNDLTAEYCERPVIAGPIEATATGNLIAQLLATGEIKDLNEGKAVIRRSFEIREIRA